MRLVMSRGRKPAIGLLVMLAIASSAKADPSRDTNHRFGAPESGPRNVIGVKNQKCSNCHAKSAAAVEMPLPSDLQSSGDDGWILSNEMLTWSQNDPHYNAFAVLRNEQSQQMARLLGFVDETTKEPNVHRDRRCLSCHSSVPIEQMELQGEITGTETLEDPRYTIGVSCEGCHGPAGRDKSGATIGWGSAHASPGDDSGSAKSQWRFLSAKDKFDRFGYWDIRSPATQARICLSCHLGNAAQKKIITHEMYAAGHPPLPSFELSQFVRQMPRHWRRFDEKPEGVRLAYQKQKQALVQPQEQTAVDFDADEFAITRATLVSSLVAFEESLRLTADLIDVNPEPEFQPELANYACFACHHELVRDGWRKSRRLTSTPGRPTLHDWPMTLATIVDESLPADVGAIGVKSNYAAVSAALNSQPFGKRDDLTLATRKLADALAKSTEKLVVSRLKEADTRQLLKNLASYGAGTNVDYDSARQLVWASERLLTQLAERHPMQPIELQNPVSVTADRFSDDPILQEFEGPLLLWLRANRKEATPVNLAQQPEPVTRTQRSINLGLALEKIAKHDPAVTRELFSRLLRQLNEE